MREKSPLNEYLPQRNGCAGTFLIVVGLGLIGIPLQDGVPLGLFHNAYATTSFLLFELVGIAFFTGGLRALLVGAAFEKPQTESSPDIHPGEPFKFRYRQRVRQQVVIRAVDAFFVYREKVEWGNSASRSHYVYDRLVSKRSCPVTGFQRGEEIALDIDFTAPAGDMGVRNPYLQIKGNKLTCLWVVRVRIQFDRSSEVWEDCEIEIATPVPGDVPDGNTAGPEGLFDVILLEIPWQSTASVSNALKEVAPQLERSGVPYAPHSLPSVIRERVEQQEAEEIAERLRVAGAPVNVIPTNATWWIPALDKEQAQNDRATKLSS